MKTFLAFLFFILSNVSIDKHDYHSSIAEVYYNPKSSNLEVTLHLFLDDFETTLMKINNDQKLNLQIKSKEYYVYVQNYVRRRFAIVSPKKEVIVANLIDYEIEKDRAVLYIEMLDCKSIKDYSFYNTLLIEEFDDQVNIVNIESLGNKKTLLFTKDETTFPYPY